MHRGCATTAAARLAYMREDFAVSHEREGHLTDTVAHSPSSSVLGLSMEVSSEPGTRPRFLISTGNCRTLACLLKLIITRLHAKTGRIAFDAGSMGAILSTRCAISLRIAAWPISGRRYPAATSPYRIPVGIQYLLCRSRHLRRRQPHFSHATICSRYPSRWPAGIRRSLSWLFVHSSLFSLHFASLPCAYFSLCLISFKFLSAIPSVPALDNRFHVLSLLSISFDDPAFPWRLSRSARVHKN